MTLLRLALFGSALLFSLGEMGLLTAALNRYIAFLLLGAFILISLPTSLRSISLKRLAAGLSLVILAGVLAGRTGAWRLLAFAALPAGLAALMRDDDPRRQEVALLVPTTVVFMIFYLGVRHLPDVWWLTNTLAIEFSRRTGRAIGQAYAFGQTAAGVRVLAFVAAWGLARHIWARRRRWGHLLVFLFLLVAVGGAVQILLTPLAIAVQLWIPRLDFLLFNGQVLYLAAGLLPTTWYYRRTPLAAASLTWGIRARFVAVSLLAGLLLGAGLTLMPPQGSGGGRVLLLDKGYLDWSVPEYGRYGGRSGGMFGRLAGFLEAQGYEVVKVPDLLTSEALSGGKVLVIINLMDPLEPEEKQAIWEWVAAGGSLLVLGDHTGVMGIRKPFNDLLVPVGIEFEFDSATYWGQTWRDALEVLPHPVTRGLDIAEEIQIWIGASLGYGPPAQALVVGKYGYSDIGDTANADRSFLGDRRHNPGEQIGDLCLVAEARYGRGRVLVFGDTSSIQNGALVSSWAFVQRMFQYLTAPAPASVLAIRIFAAVAGVIVILLGWRPLEHSMMAWLILAVGLAAAVEITGRAGALPQLPRIAGPKATIDLSHGERFDQLTWYDDCLGGLELNLMRNGYCPLLMREFAPGLVRDSDVLVIIAPARPFEGRDLETLAAFVDAGGILVLSSGYEEKDGSESLLTLFGVEIGNVPLAHFDAEALGETAHMAEAWPLKISRPGAIHIIRYPGVADPVVAFVPRGKGGAVIVGDSQFFLNSNLEGRDQWHPGNVMFLRNLFERITSGGLEG